MENLAQFIELYHRGSIDLLDWLQRTFRIVSQGVDVEQLKQISEYLIQVEEILSNYHKSIHEVLGSTVQSIPEPMEQKGDLQFLMNSYWRTGNRLIETLKRDLPIISAGASIEFFDSLHGQFVESIRNVESLTRKIIQLNDLNRLSHEILRYRFILRMSETITKGESSRNIYEAQNILERWILALANDREPNSPDAIFSPRKLELNYPATQKMKEEFKQKGINAVSKIPLLVKLGQEYLSVPHPVKVKQFRIHQGTIHIDEFNFEYPVERIQLLSTIASTSAVYLAVARYASLLSRGQQWSIPLSIYRYFVDNLGVTVEGFASPFNSKMISLGGNFCSLFPDTDGSFGSLGDFFTSDFQGQSVFANPPFVPSIMDRMAKKILQDLKNLQSVRFIVLVPGWTDAEFYQSMDQSPWKLTDIKLESKRYHFVDLQGNRIEANFPSHIFILGTEEYRGDYSSLEDALLKVYSQ